MELPVKIDIYSLFLQNIQAHAYAVLLLTKPWKIKITFETNQCLSSTFLIILLLYVYSVVLSDHLQLHDFTTHKVGECFL